MAQSLAFFSMFVMLSVMAAAQTDQCSTVVSQLTPCASYILGQAGNPPSECCGGVKQIYNMATQPEPDRVGICNCIKGELLQLKSVVASKVAGLPQTCGVSYQMPPIDPNFDCNSVKN